VGWGVAQCRAQCRAGCLRCPPESPSVTGNAMHTLLMHTIGGALERRWPLHAAGCAWLRFNCFRGTPGLLRWAWKPQRAPVVKLLAQLDGRSLFSAAAAAAAAPGPAAGCLDAAAGGQLPGVGVLGRRLHPGGAAGAVQRGALPPQPPPASLSPSCLLSLCCIAAQTPACHAWCSNARTGTT
jgi:hypothetical protein